MQYIVKLDLEMENHLKIGLREMFNRYELNSLPSFVRDFVVAFFWHTCSHACIFGWSEGIRYHEFYTEAEGFVHTYGPDFQHHFLDIVSDLAQGTHPFIMLLDDVVTGLHANKSLELDEVLPDVLVAMLPPHGWYQLLADLFWLHLTNIPTESIENAEISLARHLVIITA